MNSDHYFEDLKTQNAYILQGQDNDKEKRAGFTPGPWIVKYDKQGLPFIGVETDPWTYQGTVATVEQGKDAHLLASAPELYEQCKLFERALASGDLSATHDGLRNCDTVSYTHLTLPTIYSV